MEDNTPPGLDEFINSAEPQAQLVNSSPNANQEPTAEAPPGLDDFVASEKYGSFGQQALTAAESGAKGLVGPLAPMAEQAMGVNPEDIRGREEANPITSGIAETAGFVAPALASLGSSAAARLGLTGVAEAIPSIAKLSQMGVADAITAKLLPVAGETLAAKIGVGAAKSAIDNILLSGSDEVSKMILNDPNQSAETAVSHIGLAGLLGGALGTAGSGAAALWEEKYAPKLSQEMANFQGRILEHQTNPDPIHSMTEELQAQFDEMGKVMSETYGANGLKAEAVSKLVPEMNEKITNQVGDISAQLEDSLNKLSSKNDSHANLLADKIQTFKQEVNSNNPAQVFTAIENLKKSLQEDARYIDGVSPLSERPYRNAVKELAYNFRTALEDNSVWGEAGDAQASINAAAKKNIDATKDFRKLMTTEVMGKRVVDPGKVTTFLKQAGKPNAEIKGIKLQNFIDSNDELKTAVNKIYDKLNVESPVQNTPLNVTMSALQEKTLGSKIADTLVEKGLSHEGAKGAGAALGGLLGHAVGHGELGAIIGAHTLGPFFSSTLPGIAKFLMSNGPNGNASKAAIEYATSVVKGDALVNKAAKGIFRYESATQLPEFVKPTDKDAERLDKYLKKVQDNPQALLDSKSQLNHFMPEHSSAQLSAIGNAVSYLNSLRPNTDRLGPLDPKRIPSAVEKANYMNALKIGQNPLSVMAKVKDGTITHQDLTHLQNMYPSLYSGMQAKMSDALLEAVKQEKMIPYKTKIGISMFMAQPLDSTMNPQAIMAAQNVGAMKQQQQAMQQQTATKGTKSSPALQKMSSMYQTADQKREARQQK